MDVLNAISAELSKADDLQKVPARYVGMMKIVGAKETIQEASMRPDPKPLWLSLWYEGEACCLFADTNNGKSIMAVQIAESIARSGRKVLYFDFELSDKQFQLRYTDQAGNLYDFSPNLFRVELDPMQMNDEDFEEMLLADIEACAMETDAKVLIIDNISFLCTDDKKGEIAGQLMKRIVQMKKGRDLSILILAHTPKRNMQNPITQNDLAGSKKFINFFDSAFTIGKSAKDSALRYIKQIKCRNGSFEFDAENVIVCQITKKDCFTQFEELWKGEEADHLRTNTNQEEKAVDDAQVMELSKQGKTQRAIAAELGISPASVNRAIKRNGGKDGE